MTINETTNYNPDDMEHCVPTSGIVCQYCKNRGVCPSKMQRDDIGAHSVSDAEMNGNVAASHTHDFSN